MVIEPQSQVSDALFLRTQRYMQINKVTQNKLAEKIGVSPYILNKALDRRIKMKIFNTSIEKLANAVK